MRNHAHRLEVFRKHSPALISLFLMLMIFTSRLSVSITAISLVISLLLIFLTVSPKEILKTMCYNPVARAAAMLYGCVLIGAFYSYAPFSDQLHTLKQYLFLLWISVFITFFQTSFPQLASRFTIKKAHTYSSIFMYGAVLVAFLGCLNAWHIVDVRELVHGRLVNDPLEYPFGTFSFSLSFAAYLSVHKMRFASNRQCYYRYLACFIFLSFFIFFVSHERTAYVLYIFLLLVYGFQHFGFKGLFGIIVALVLLALTAYNTSKTFHHRTLMAVHDIQIYQKGNPATSTGLRLFYLEASYAIWKAQPIFGYGTGSFKTIYLLIDGYNAGGETNTPETALDQPHNDYAYILVQLGLFGFCFLLWLLGQQFFRSFQLPLFEKQCAQAFILSFMVGALDTTQFFYATSSMDYLFFTALFYSRLPKYLVRK